MAHRKRGAPASGCPGREIGQDNEGVELIGQIGANIYLDTADEGGELETWELVITDADYAELSDKYPGSYGYPRSMLPDRSLLISPQTGDLILVNTRNVHAVRKIARGHRMTLSGFVGNSGTGQPLRCWS